MLRFVGEIELMVQQKGLPIPAHPHSGWSSVEVLAAAVGGLCLIAAATIPVLLRQRNRKRMAALRAQTREKH